MRTVVSPSCFATGPMRRSNRSPSPSSTTSGDRASGRPATWVGKSSSDALMGVSSHRLGRAPRGFMEALEQPADRSRAELYGVDRDPFVLGVDELDEAHVRG